MREFARRAPRTADLEDLAQDAVRSTLAFLARCADEPKDLPAFLKFRALGVLSDRRKRMRAALPTVPEELAREREDPSPSPEHALRSRQLALALVDCERTLSVEQRAVVELRYRGSLPTEAIAARLGVHRNTVNVRVFRALAALRECLGRKGFRPGDAV